MLSGLVSCVLEHLREKTLNREVGWIGSRLISYQRFLGVKIASRKVRKDAKEDGIPGRFVYAFFLNWTRWSVMGSAGILPTVFGIFLSSVRRWMFSVRCSRFPKKTEEGKTEDRRQKTEDWKRRTSNIQHRTPNVEQKRRKKPTEGVVFLSSVRRWMFSVRCSMFAFPKKTEDRNKERHARSKGSVLVLERSGLGSS